DLVLIGTQIDLRQVIKIQRPAMRVYYDLADHGEPTLAELIKKKLN
ncbi:MAG: GTPase, partial [Deltaproteobacteria bacterium]|nr:GTPase [Deltaproteobacteria bacterium]